MSKLRKPFANVLGLAHCTGATFATVITGSLLLAIFYCSSGYLFEYPQNKEQATGFYSMGSSRPFLPWLFGPLHSYYGIGTLP